MSDNPTYVLDTYAFMAYLRREPGYARVTELFEEASRGTARLLLTVVNYGEIVYITDRRRGEANARRVIALLDSLPIEIVDVARGLTLAAARIKARYRVSYADAFAIALVQQTGSVVVTGDDEFRAVEHIVRVEWLPPRK